MTREEIIAAMNECATELGQAPNVTEFRRLTKVSLNQIRKNFGNYTRLLSASGVERHGAGYTVSLQSLFLDWARVVRSLGRIPTIESRNFLTHMHSASECDLIVCWSHNWPDCPLEVLELKKFIEGGRLPNPLSVR